MQENSIYLDIYGFQIRFSSDDNDLLNKVKSDFNYFLKNEFNHCSLNIKIHKVDRLDLLPKNLYPTKQSSNSITYDEENIRYNDYYGKALTILNYGKSTFDIYSSDSSLAYELSFLIIQSRSGKYLDKLGLHKIHACSFVYKDQNYILALPSKGGKTSTLIQLLKNFDIDLISDDCPIINSRGEVLPYPLRIGVENKEDYDEIPGADISKVYEFKRQSYKKKYLLPIHALKNKVSTSSKTNLIFGFRGTFEKPRVNKISKYSSFINLWYHMIIGIGLPLIIEYFIENSIKDYVSNFGILLSRIRNGLALVMKSNCYSIELSSSIKDNVEELLKINRN
jgi:hypothetical protein